MTSIVDIWPVVMVNVGIEADDVEAAADDVAVEVLAAADELD